MGSYPPESISRIAVMMPDHNDPIAVKALFEENMVWKFPEIAPSPPAGIIMVPFRIALDGIDCIVDLFPKLVAQVV